MTQYSETSCCQHCVFAASGDNGSSFKACIRPSGLDSGHLQEAQPVVSCCPGAESLCSPNQQGKKGLGKTADVDLMREKVGSVPPLSSATGFAGTPGYLSPEVLRKDPYGKPVDIWACGKPIPHTQLLVLRALSFQR